MDFAPMTLFAVRYSNTAKYSAPFTPAFPLVNGTDTMIHYPFTNGSGTTITDTSSPARNGTLFGGGTWGTRICP